MINDAPHRLREERERIGKSQRALATALGISKNTQLAYETGTSPITLDYLAGAERLGIDVSYIVTGDRAGDTVRDGRQSYRAEPADDRSDLVDVSEIDPSFGLGAVFMDDPPIPEKRSFSRAWLRQISTSPPSELYWARGKGDSMKPTIGDGEIVLIDSSQRTPRDSDLIWAFAFGDVGSIKRLRPMPDGSVKILSDNELVDPESAVDGQIHIFGRVVAVVKKI